MPAIDLTLTISCEWHDAFGTDEDTARAELGRILHDAADRIEGFGGSSYIGVEGGGNVYVYRFDDMISEIAHDIAERYRRDNQPALEHTGLWPAERAAQGELGL